MTPPSSINTPNVSRRGTMFIWRRSSTPMSIRHWTVNSFTHKHEKRVNSHSPQLHGNRFSSNIVIINDIEDARNLFVYEAIYKCLCYLYDIILLEAFRNSFYSQFCFITSRAAQRRCFSFMYMFIAGAGHAGRGPQL